MLSLDHDAAERGYLESAAAQQAPEAIYDKRWALALLEKAMDRLGKDYAAAGKQPLFQVLQPMLFTEGTGDAYRVLAADLGLSEGAVKVALHRLRKRLREVVRAEVARTVDNPADVEEELHCLMAALQA